MPRKPAKKRRRTAPGVADWVDRYIETRVPPEPGEEGHDSWLGWYFFGDEVPGLPNDWRQMPPIPQWEM